MSSFLTITINNAIDLLFRFALININEPIDIKRNYQEIAINVVLKLHLVTLPPNWFGKSVFQVDVKSPTLET